MRPSICGENRQVEQHGETEREQHGEEGPDEFAEQERVAGNGVRETEAQRPLLALTRKRVKRKQYREKRKQIGDDKHPIYLRRCRTQTAHCTQVEMGISHPPNAF